MVWAHILARPRSFHDGEDVRVFTHGCRFLSESPALKGPETWWVGDRNCEYRHTVDDVNPALPRRP